MNSNDYIAELPGVKAVGQFDLTGMYFSELKSSDAYMEINTKIVAGGKYENHPSISQLLSVDEELLPFVKGGVSEYTETTSGNLPIYASEIFKSILPVGTLLTDNRTSEVYEVAGYFSKGSQWVEEDDLIRFPMVSTDGWFIAPFSDESKSDIMTQLSCLHNTYVLLSEDADIEYLKQVISNYSMQHGFEATAVTLAEEYEIYRMETKTFTTRQAAIAVFISVMAISSIIAVFTTNTLLKRKQYGVLIANGLTPKDIALCIATEITVIVFSSTLLAWMMKLAEFVRSTDLFREVLLTAHIQYTLKTLSLKVNTDYRLQIDATCESGAMEIGIIYENENAKTYTINTDTPCNELLTISANTTSEVTITVSIEPDTKGEVIGDLLAPAK